jgi:hypothetical protein
MQDIGHQQFLVLLLMLQPQPHKRARLLRQGIQCLQQRCIHRLPVACHFIRAWARQQATRRPRMAGAHAFVV